MTERSAPYLTEPYQKHTHTHARARARTRRHAHTRTQAHTQAHTHAHTRTQTHARTHTHTRVRERARTLTHTHTPARTHRRGRHTHARTHTRALTHTHARTHARTHTHTHTHAHARTHPHPNTHSRVGRGDIGKAVKNSLEIVIKQVHLEGGFKRGGSIRVAECSRQIVPDRWASIRKKDLSPNVFVFTRGVTKVCVSDADRNCLAGV